MKMKANVPNFADSKWKEVNGWSYQMDCCSNDESTCIDFTLETKKQVLNEVPQRVAS